MLRFGSSSPRSHVCPREVQRSRPAPQGWPYSMPPRKSRRHRCAPRSHERVHANVRGELPLLPLFKCKIDNPRFKTHCYVDKRKDDGVWTIPKGEVHSGEDLLNAAQLAFE